MASKDAGRRKEFCFTWNVENCRFFCDEEDGQIVSPEFVIHGLKQSKWTLSVYPRGSTSGNYVACYLNRSLDSDGPEEIETVYELSLLGSDGSAPISREETAQSYPKGGSFGYDEFIERDVIFNRKRAAFLPHGILTVRCRIWKIVGEFEEEVLCFARTLVEVERRSFLLAIEQFSTHKPGIIKTYRIKSASDSTPVMSLNLYSKKGLHCNETMHIQLIYVVPDTAFVTLRSLYLDSNGDTRECGMDEFLFDNIIDTNQITLSLTKQALMDQKQLYLPNDILTLYCELAFPTRSVHDQIEKIQYGRVPLLTRKSNEYCLGGEDCSSVSLTTLTENFKSLFTDSFLCDTKLKTSSEAFKVHKSILGARSPVFKAMFTSHMKELTLNEIDIQDLDGDTVRRMLLYIYTTDVEDLQWESALDLYAAADKYEILTLKSKCSVFLKGSLSPVNACDLLVFADMHHDGDLKSYVQDYILRNDMELMNSHEWKQLMVTHLQLAAETMHLKFQK